MADVTIFHNPRCSKSRSAMDTIGAQSVDADVVEYLKAPPDRQALADIIAKLEDPVADLVRKDGRFQELGLDAADYHEPEAVIDLLQQHPELMERPVLVKGDRAIIGRPTERVAPFLAG